MARCRQGVRGVKLLPPSRERTHEVWVVEEAYVRHGDELHLVARRVVKKIVGIPLEDASRG